MRIPSNHTQESVIENDANAVIKIKSLYKSFGTHVVLRDFDLNLYPGENVVVLGKSGSGKSVLIKCIIGLMKPDKGTITVLDKNVTTLNSSDLDKLRIKIGFL